MDNRSHLRPLNEAFFERALTTEASILQHLRFAFQTERGSFLADPVYGCDADFFCQSPGTFDESRLLRFLEEAIMNSEPRISSAKAHLSSRHGDAVSVELEIHYREIINGGVDARKIGLKALVDLHVWSVDMEVAR